MSTLLRNPPTSTNISGIVSCYGQTQTQDADYYNNFPTLDAHFICERPQPTPIIAIEQLFENLTYIVHNSSVLFVQTANSGEMNLRVNVKPTQPKKHPLSAFLGTWKGSDLKKMLKMVHKTRSQL